MRYENQNPQYIVLIEKIEEKEKKIKKLDRDYQFACKYNKAIVDSLK